MPDWWIDDSLPADPLEHENVLDPTKVETETIIAPFPKAGDRLPQPGELYEVDGKPIGVVYAVEVIQEMMPGFTPETRSRTEIKIMTQSTFDQEMTVPINRPDKDLDLESFIKGMMFK